MQHVQINEQTIEIHINDAADIHCKCFIVDLENNVLTIKQQIDNEEPTAVHLDLLEFIDVFGVISKELFARSQTFYSLPY